MRLLDGGSPAAHIVGGDGDEGVGVALPESLARRVAKIRNGMRRQALESRRHSIVDDGRRWRWQVRDKGVVERRVLETLVAVVVAGKCTEATPASSRCGEMPGSPRRVPAVGRSPPPLLCARSGMLKY